MSKQKKTRYYHASPRRITVGTILVPALYPNYENTGCGVFVTTSPVPHVTIVRLIESSNEEWHVYEVQPIGNIYVGDWGDLFCDSAEVIKYIGNAQGILANKKKKFKPRQWKTCGGSEVNVKEVKDKVKGRGEWGGYKTVRPWFKWMNDNGYR